MPITQAPPGGVQFNDIIEPVVPFRQAGTVTTAAAAANAVYLYRFRVARAITIANAKIWIGATSAGNLALGIYTSDGTTWTRVAATADTAAGSANALQTVAFTTPYPLVPGVDYWAAFGATDATLTVLRSASMLSGVGIVGNLTLVKGSAYSSGLPATITSPNTSTIVVVMALTT